MTTGDLGLSRVPVVLRLRDESRRRRDPDGIGVRNRFSGGASETNPARLYSPPLRPPVDRFRDVPAEGQPNAADSQSAPKAAPAVSLDKREAGYYPGYDPNGEGRRILQALTRQPCVALILPTGIAECVIGTFLTPVKLGIVRYA